MAAKQGEFFQQVLNSAARVADMVFAIRFGQFREAVEGRVTRLEAEVRTAISTIDPESTAKLQGMLTEAQGIRDAMNHSVEDFRATYSLPSSDALTAIERDALEAIGLNASESEVESAGAATN